MAVSLRKEVILPEGTKGAVSSGFTSKWICRLLSFKLSTQDGNPSITFCSAASFCIYLQFCNGSKRQYVIDKKKKCDAKLILFVCLFAERAAFIEKAVAQARREYDTQHLVSAQVGNMPSVQKLARAFKTPSPEAIAQGTAQLKFERMVKLAEKQIIEDKRQAVGQSAEQLAESFAEEVYHVPGSLLTAQEVYRLYEYSGCSDFVSDCMECDGDFDDMWRRSDGTCNNVRYPFYGAAGTMMSRLIEAYYEDGVSRPRGFLQMRGFMGADRFGPPNPSPRVVSVKVIKDRPRDDPNFTLMLMQWGQFMDHDLDAMPEYGSECAHTCDISDDEDAACLPFPVRPNDLNVSTVADFCHDFRRSLPACYDVEEPEEGETYLPRQREHFNSITHHIDGSGIYHSASGPLILHLLGENGKLKVTDEFDPIYTLPEGMQ